MAEETRRLLKMFGIAVTNLEESVEHLRASLDGAGEDSTANVEPLERYFQASGALMKQWAQVVQLLADTHERADGPLRAALAKLHRHG